MPQETFRLQLPAEFAESSELRMILLILGQIKERIRFEQKRNIVKIILETHDDRDTKKLLTEIYRKLTEMIDKTRSKIQLLEHQNPYTASDFRMLIPEDIFKNIYNVWVDHHEHQPQPPRKRCSDMFP